MLIGDYYTYVRKCRLDRALLRFVLVPGQKGSKRSENDAAPAVSDEPSSERNIPLAFPTMRHDTALEQNETQAENGKPGVTLGVFQAGNAKSHGDEA